MTLVLASPHCPDSLVARLDPRWKLAALLIAAGVFAVLQSLPAAETALAAALILVLVSRLPMRWYLQRLAPVVLFVGAVVLTLPLLVRDTEPVLRLGPLALSQSGLRLAILLACKGLGIVSLMLVLVGTAPLEDSIRAAHALRVPGLLVHLSMLTYRYLFVLAGELAQLRVALRLRGYHNRLNRHSFRTIGHVVGTLLVRSYERSERVGQAMRLRGFDGQFRSLRCFQTSRRDVLGSMVVIGCALGLLAWDISCRG
jgi:cobalt/nickel transport system permease protein